MVIADKFTDDSEIKKPQRSMRSYSLIKTQHRNRLSVQSDFIVAVDIEPRFDSILAKKAGSSVTLIFVRTCTHLCTIIYDNKYCVFENPILV